MVKKKNRTNPPPIPAPAKTKAAPSSNTQKQKKASQEEAEPAKKPTAATETMAPRPCAPEPASTKVVEPAPPARPATPCPPPSYAPLNFAEPRPPLFDGNNYPPVDPCQSIARYNHWRAQHEPLMFIWQTRTLPWLTDTCHRAKDSVQATGIHAAQRLRDSLDPNARALANMRAQYAEQLPQDEWWLVHLHRITVGIQPWLTGYWQGWMGDSAGRPASSHPTQEDEWVILDLDDVD